MAITLNLSKRFVVVTGDGVTKNFEASAIQTWNLSDRNAKGYIIDIRQEGMSLSDLMANDDVIGIEYVAGKGVFRTQADGYIGGGEGVSGFIPHRV